MAIKRIDKWATALHNFLLSRAKTPFAWGTNDCCLVAADAVQAITGTDIASDFRSKYTDQASAFALIKTVTGGSTAEDAAAYCAQKAGLTELTHVLTAQRGDLVVLNDGGSTIAGFIHLNGRNAVSVGEDGLKRLPLSAIKRAWRVG
jgi:hypothetical protein